MDRVLDIYLALTGDNSWVVCPDVSEEAVRARFRHRSVIKVIDVTEENQMDFKDIREMVNASGFNDIQKQAILRVLYDSGISDFGEWYL